MEWIKVTNENWKDVEHDIMESGIANATSYENGGLHTITTKKGIRYEFSPEVIKQLIESRAMEVRVGRKVGTK